VYKLSNTCTKSKLITAVLELLAEAGHGAEATQLTQSYHCATNNYLLFTRSFRDLICHLMDSMVDDIKHGNVYFHLKQSGWFLGRGATDNVGGQHAGLTKYPAPKRRRLNSAQSYSSGNEVVTEDDFYDVSWGVFPGKASNLRWVHFFFEPAVLARAFL